MRILYFIWYILLYKYNNKPSEEEKKKEELKKNYLLSKIKMINEKHQEKLNSMITNLPKFESNFKMLHKILLIFIIWSI